MISLSLATKTFQLMVQINDHKKANLESLIAKQREIINRYQRKLAPHPLGKCFIFDFEMK